MGLTKRKFFYIYIYLGQGVFSTSVLPFFSLSFLDLEVAPQIQPRDLRGHS